MRKVVFFLKSNFTFERYPYLTVLSNVFLGYSFGRIVITPGDELSNSLLIKVLLILGTGLFFKYLFCLRRAFTGVTRTIDRKIRPLLREALLCAGLNALIFLIALSFFFYKSLYL